jgi:hypothetical protein
MLLIFRWVSNQSGIRHIKDLIKAHFLEIPLFRHDLGIIFQAQRKILRLNLTYMRYALTPMLVMIFPIALILIQLNLYLGYIPLKPGQAAIVSLKLKSGSLRGDSNTSQNLKAQLELKASKGLDIETPPLRIIDEDEVDWRIRATKYGNFDLIFKVAGQEYKKIVLVTDKLVGVAPSIDRASFVSQILNPLEPPLPSDSIVESIKVGYETRGFRIYHWSIHWIILFFGLSILFAFALKGLFKVEV